MEDGLCCIFSEALLDRSGISRLHFWESCWTIWRTWSGRVISCIYLVLFVYITSPCVLQSATSVPSCHSLDSLISATTYPTLIFLWHNGDAFDLHVSTAWELLRCNASADVKFSKRGMSGI